MDNENILAVLEDDNILAIQLGKEVTKTLAKALDRSRITPSQYVDALLKSAIEMIALMDQIHDKFDIAEFGPDRYEKFIQSHKYFSEKYSSYMEKYEHIKS